MGSLQPGSGVASRPVKPEDKVLAGLGTRPLSRHDPIGRQSNTDSTFTGCLWGGGLSQSKIINNDCDKYISLILTLLSHSPCRGALFYAAQSKPRSKAPIYTAGCLRQ